MTAAEVLEIFMEDGSDVEEDLEFAEDLDTVRDIIPDEEEVQVANLEIREDDEIFTESRSKSRSSVSSSRSGFSRSILSPMPDIHQDFTASPDLDLSLDLDKMQTQLDLDLPLNEPGMSEWVRNTDNFPLSPPFTGQSGFQIAMPV